MRSTWRKKFSRKLATGGLVLTLGVMGIACGGESAGPDTGADVEDITGEGDEDQAQGDQGQDQGAFDEQAFFNDPTDFIGQQVTVSGQVTEDVGPQSFQLSGDDVGGQPLLVVNASQDPSVNSTVQVTGTVIQVNEQSFTEAGLEWNADVFGAFEGQAAINASSVQQTVASESPAS